MARPWKTPRPRRRRVRRLGVPDGAGKSSQSGSFRSIRQVSLEELNADSEAADGGASEIAHQTNLSFLDELAVLTAEIEADGDDLDLDLAELGGDDEPDPETDQEAVQEEPGEPGSDEDGEPGADEDGEPGSDEDGEPGADEDGELLEEEFDQRQFEEFSEEFQAELRSSGGSPAVSSDSEVEPISGPDAAADEGREGSDLEDDPAPPAPRSEGDDGDVEEDEESSADVPMSSELMQAMEEFEQSLSDEDRLGDLDDELDEDLDGDGLPSWEGSSLDEYLGSEWAIDSALKEMESIIPGDEEDEELPDGPPSIEMWLSSSGLRRASLDDDAEGPKDPLGLGSGSLSGDGEPEPEGRHPRPEGGSPAAPEPPPEPREARAELSEAPDDPDLGGGSSAPEGQESLEAASRRGPEDREEEFPEEPEEEPDAEPEPDGEPEDEGETSAPGSRSDESAALGVGEEPGEHEEQDETSSGEIIAPPIDFDEPIEGATTIGADPDDYPEMASRDPDPDEPSEEPADAGASGEPELPEPVIDASLDVPDPPPPSLDEPDDDPDAEITMRHGHRHADADDEPETERDVRPPPSVTMWSPPPDDLEGPTETNFVDGPSPEDETEIGPVEVPPRLEDEEATPEALPKAVPVAADLPDEELPEPEIDLNLGPGLGLEPAPSNISVELSDEDLMGESGEIAEELNPLELEQLSTPGGSEPPDLEDLDVELSPDGADGEDEDRLSFGDSLELEDASSPSTATASDGEEGGKDLALVSGQARALPSFLLDDDDRADDVETEVEVDLRGSPGALELDDPTDIEFVTGPSLELEEVGGSSTPTVGDASVAEISLPALDLAESAFDPDKTPVHPAPATDSVPGPPEDLAAALGDDEPSADSSDDEAFDLITSDIEIHKQDEVVVSVHDALDSSLEQEPIALVVDDEDDSIEDSIEVQPHKLGIPKSASLAALEGVRAIGEGDSEELDLSNLDGDGPLEIDLEAEGEAPPRRVPVQETSTPEVSKLLEEDTTKGRVRTPIWHGQRKKS